MPKVTVILTSYNHARWLPESIDSVLEQDFSDFELLIIDDASTDESWSIIERYAAEDDRIKAFRNEHNICDENCFVDYLADETHGDYIAIAHSDDVWKPGKLSKQIAYLDAHDEVAACFGWIEAIDDEGKPFDGGGVVEAWFNIENRSRFEWLALLFHDSNHLAHPSLLIRTSAFDDYDLHPHGLISTPDYFKWVRLCRFADIHVIQEKIACHRLHYEGPDANTSGDNIANHYRYDTELLFILREYEKIDDQNDFLAVFPEAKRYMVDGRIVLPYALGKICLDMPASPFHLFGLDLLHRALCDDALRASMQELYGYGNLQYKADEERFDIFGRFPEKCFLDARIDLEGQTIAQSRAYIPGSAKNVFVASIPAAPHDRLLALFPDWTTSRRFHIESVELDGRSLTIKPINAARTSEGWDYFVTTSPRYDVALPAGSVGELRFVLESHILTSEELESCCAILPEGQGKKKGLFGRLSS